MLDEHSTKELGLRWVQKGFGFVNQKHAFLTYRCVQQDAGKAPHPVALSLDGRKLLQTRNVADADSIFRPLNRRPFANMKWDEIASVSVDNEVGSKGFSE